MHNCNIRDPATAGTPETAWSTTTVKRSERGGTLTTAWTPAHRIDAKLSWTARTAEKPATALMMAKQEKPQEQGCQQQQGRQ